jgi:hypothetical protein
MASLAFKYEAGVVRFGRNTRPDLAEYLTAHDKAPQSHLWHMAMSLGIVA